jgi:hypothetical protein
VSIDTIVRSFGHRLYGAPGHAPRAAAVDFARVAEGSA